MNPGYPNPPPGYAWTPPPGGHYGGPPMPMKSTTPRTLGTLSMVFGGIVTALSLFNLLAGKAFTTMTVQAGQRAAFERYLDSLSGYTMVQSIVMLVMSIALVYIGTGQRGYKRWATGASVMWGLIALVVVVGQLIGAVAIALPALEVFARDIAHGGPGASAIIMSAKIGVFVGIAFYAPYPIILISSFRKPHNVAAMDAS